MLLPDPRGMGKEVVLALLLLTEGVTPRWNDGVKKIDVHYFLAVKFVSSAINQPFALERLYLIEPLVICVRKKIHTCPRPGVARENIAVCRSKESPPPLGVWLHELGSTYQ